MDVMWHAIHNNWFLIFSLDYARNVFMQIIFPTVMYQILPSFNSKNYLDIDLGKCARHGKNFRLKYHPSGVLYSNLLIG